ncbi:hypothetical protein MASR1M74_04960 [Lentimicrobium sp.]
MKTKFLLLIALMGTTTLLHAQDDMPVVWESKMDHKIIYSGTGTEERGYSYAASEKEITVFDNSNGKVKWNKKFKRVGS